MPSAKQSLIEESIAAIAMGLGSAHKHARAYHAALADDQGYMGFYKLAVEAAHELERRVKELGLEWGETIDFYLTTEHLANNLLDFMIQRKSTPSNVEWPALVNRSLVEGLHAKKQS